MEVKEGLWPASPSAQYYNSSVLSVSIMGVMETEVPITINHARAMLLLKDVFLPINPRFSSIMVLSLSLSLCYLLFFKVENTYFAAFPTNKIAISWKIILRIILSIFSPFKKYVNKNEMEDI